MKIKKIIIQILFTLFLIKFAFKRKLLLLNKMRLFFNVKFLFKVLPRAGFCRQLVLAGQISSN